MAWNDAIVRICVGDDTTTWNNGTGFFIDKGLLLTALHVITDADGPDPLICIANYTGCQSVSRDQNAQHAGACGPCGEGFVQAQVVWRSEELDVALLSCEPGDETLLRLAASEHSVSMDVVSGGFPKGAKVKDEREYFSVSGTAYQRRKEDSIFQYDLTVYPKDASDWGGISGAPAFEESTQRVLGIVVHARRAMDGARHLEVVPSPFVINAEGFAQHLGDWRSHEPPADFRSKFLANVKRRLDDVLSKLTQAECEDLSDLANRIDASLAGQEITAEKLFSIAENVVLEIGLTQTNRHRDDQAAANKFALIGQLLYYDSLNDEQLRVISYVGSKRQDVTADPFSCLAHTLTLLEMLAAATDGLNPLFEGPRDISMPPGSKWILPFTIRESGAESSNDSEAYVRHIAGITGIDLVPPEVADERLDSYFRERGLIRPAERDPANWDFSTTAKRIDIRLAQLKKQGKRSYVLPVVRPEDPMTARALRSSLQRLKELVPSILVLGLILDEMGALNEEAGLEALLNTIPTKDT